MEGLCEIEWGESAPYVIKPTYISPQRICGKK